MLKETNENVIRIEAKKKDNRWKWTTKLVEDHSTREQKKA